MKLPNAKIEACTAKNDIREYLNCVYLERDGKGARVVATDGAGLVCVPVDADDDDAPGYVTPEAIKMARKAAGRGEPATMACNGALTMPNGATLPRPDAADLGPYPDWRRIDPALPDDTAPDLIIDADLLLRIGRGLVESGAPVVRLYLQRDDDGKIDVSRPIVVKPRIGADGAIGLVMPCRE